MQITHFVAQIKLGTTSQLLKETDYEQETKSRPK